MIEAQFLSKRFGAIQAVNNISFSVGRGEVVGFLGPNGAGKSTTMKMITGYLPMTSGRISIGGHDIEREPIACKRHLGYLPEGAPLYGEMTPASLLGFVAALRNLSAADRRRRIDYVVDVLALQPVLLRRIEALSKGYKRRVGLALAVLHDPEVLILDEPTDGLDPNQKHEVRRLIRAMGRDKAIIISTHLLEEVDTVCDRAIVIDQGRIVLQGTPGELHARSPYHHAAVVRVDPADLARAQARLERLPGVAEVEARTDVVDATALWVKGKDGAPIAHQVSLALKDEGVAILAIRTEQGRLDEVFRAVTGGGVADPLTP